MVGSTTLSQRLDPEEIHAVIDGALARGAKVVEAHRGKVLQYAGDNLLAAFGADETREDDAERAVRCGLALLELGRVLGAEVQAAHGHAGFNVRIGIHSGGVLLGGGVDAEGSIRGIAVNIAARMEQTAPSGALRISHATWAQVRGLFDADAQEPLPVKGVDTPVRSYFVQRARARAFRVGTRGIEGVATRMIGRDAELQALQDAFGRLFAERRLATVTVVAEAGIGKTRLLYEFEAWRAARPETLQIFRGRATQQTQDQPFGLLRDIVARRLKIADDDTIETARVKIERGVAPLYVGDDGPSLAEGHAHLLGHLIGIDFSASRHLRGILDDPRQIRSRAFHAAAQMLRRVSETTGRPGAAATRRPALGRRRHARLPAPSGRGRSRRAAAGAGADASDVVRAARRLGQRRAAAHRAEPARREHQQAAGRRTAEEPESIAVRSVRAGLGPRRRQPVLHGRAGEDADRPRGHRDRRVSVDVASGQAGADADPALIDGRIAGAARWAAEARTAGAAGSARIRARTAAASA